MVLIVPKATLMDAELHNKLFAEMEKGLMKNNKFVIHKFYKTLFQKMQLILNHAKCPGEH
jgi:hypothetical protein